MTPFVVRCRRLDHAGDLPPPGRATSGSVGLDLRAAVDSSISVAPGDRALVPTGFAVAIPSGHEGQVRPRSGLAWRSGVTVLNAPGTIDPDYRGELLVLLVNHGNAPVIIRRGERIAQLVVVPVIAAELVEVDRLDDTARDDGGFGSTGCE